MFIFLFILQRENHGDIIFSIFDNTIFDTLFFGIGAGYNSNNKSSNNNDNNKSNFNSLVDAAAAARFHLSWLLFCFPFCVLPIFLFFHLCLFFFFCHMRHFLWSALRSRLALISEIKRQADNVNNFKCPACVSVRVNACVCVCVSVCILWPPHYKRVYSSSHGTDFRFPFPLAHWFALPRPATFATPHTNRQTERETMSRTGCAGSC